MATRSRPGSGEFRCSAVTFRCISVALVCHGLDRFGAAGHPCVGRRSMGRRSASPASTAESATKAVSPSHSHQRSPRRRRLRLPHGRRGWPRPIPSGSPQRPQTIRPDRLRSAFTDQLPQLGQAIAPGIPIATEVMLTDGAIPRRRFRSASPLPLPCQQPGPYVRNRGSAPGGRSATGSSAIRSKSAKSNPGPTQQ
jgi:hypothetical protein